MIVIFGASALVQWRLRSKFAKYSEVGLQNGGMASGLAVNVLRSTDAALAPALFGPIMNVTGSLLASWWGKRPVTGNARPVEQVIGAGS